MNNVDIRPSIVPITNPIIQFVISFICICEYDVIGPMGREVIPPPLALLVALRLSSGHLAMSMKRESN